MTKKNKLMFKNTLPLDLENCQKLEHLMPVPKSRSSSITSMESTDSDGSITMAEVLLPPPVREFDDLTAFESFVRDETWDNEFDYYHAKLLYYPPFVLKECHNNLEKIKPTMNRNSKRFRRHVNHHIQNHLLKDLEKCCGYKLNMEKVETLETPKNIIWRYSDETDHGFTPEEEDKYGRHWRLDLEIKCNNENALVEVDYKSVPIM